jgi:hypothetical protein
MEEAFFPAAGGFELEGRAVVENEEPDDIVQSRNATGHGDNDGRILDERFLRIKTID